MHQAPLWNWAVGDVLLLHLFRDVSDAAGNQAGSLRAGVKAWCVLQVAQCLDWIGKQGLRRFRARATQQSKLKSQQPTLRQMHSAMLLRATLPDSATSEPQVTARSAADGVSSLAPFPHATHAWPTDTAASEGTSVDASARAGQLTSLHAASERRTEATDAGMTDVDESESLVRPKKALPQDALPPAPLQTDTTLVPRLDTRQRSARVGGDAGASAAAENTLGVALLSKPVKLSFRGAAIAAAGAAGLLDEAGQPVRAGKGSEMQVAEVSTADPVPARGEVLIATIGAGEASAEAPAAVDAPKAGPKMAVEAPKVSRRLMERGARRIRGELLPSEEPVCGAAILRATRQPLAGVWLHLNLSAEVVLVNMAHPVHVSGLSRNPPFGLPYHSAPQPSSLLVNAERVCSCA